jgi:hypothetical protein
MNISSMIRSISLPPAFSRSSDSMCLVRVPLERGRWEALIFFRLATIRPVGRGGEDLAVGDLGDVGDAADLVPQGVHVLDERIVAVVLREDDELRLRAGLLATPSQLVGEVEIEVVLPIAGDLQPADPLPQRLRLLHQREGDLVLGFADEDQDVRVAVTDQVEIDLLDVFEIDEYHSSHNVCLLP